MAESIAYTLECVEKYCDSGVFIETKMGYLGCAPCGVQVGDGVCIAYGCPVPLVARKSERGLPLIGDAYLYGMMDG